MDEDLRTALAAGAIRAAVGCDAGPRTGGQGASRSSGGPSRKTSVSNFEILAAAPPVDGRANLRLEWAGAIVRPALRCSRLANPRRSQPDHVTPRAHLERGGEARRRRSVQRARGGERGASAAAPRRGSPGGEGRGRRDTGAACLGRCDLDGDIDHRGPGRNLETPFAT